MRLRREPAPSPDVRPHPSARPRGQPVDHQRHDPVRPVQSAEASAALGAGLTGGRGAASTSGTPMGRAGLRRPPPSSLRMSRLCSGIRRDDEATPRRPPAGGRTRLLRGIPRTSAGRHRRRYSRALPRCRGRPRRSSRDELGRGSRAAQRLGRELAGATRRVEDGDRGLPRAGVYSPDRTSGVHCRPRMCDGRPFGGELSDEVIVRSSGFPRGGIDLRV